MPIDDIPFLLQNSEKTSATLFIDSGLRDRQYYPTPAEYVVPFDEPLRNVFGLDVLDAAVAGTTYNVDSNNNLLTMVCIDCAHSTALEGTWGTSILSHTPDDDTSRGIIVSAFFEMGFSADLRTWLADHARNAEVVMVTEDVMEQLPAPGPPLASKQPTLPTDVLTDAYVLVRRRLGGVRMLTMPDTTGLTLSACTSAARAHVESEAAARVAGAGALHVVYMNTHYAVPLTGGQATQDAAVALFRTQPVGTYALVPTGVPDLLDVVYFTGARVDSLDPYRASARWAFHVWHIALEPGNYTSTQLQQQLQQQLGAVTSIDTLSTCASAITKQGRIRWSASPSTRFILVPEHSTAAPLLGYDLRADDGTVRRLAPNFRPYNVLTFGAGSSSPWFMSVLRYNTVMSIVAQEMDAPGLINLLGTRYITLRCPEIEQHMGHTGKYGRYSTGIGVFRLANSSEVVQLRFDYVSLIRRPFHPIGRLTRLTLRFENSDGSLYDFKGINHQLLLTIKYYAEHPTDTGRTAGAERVVRSVLCPDYNPDFVAWTAQQQREEARATWDRGYDDESDQEDEEGDDDDDEYRASDDEDCDGDGGGPE